MKFEERTRSDFSFFLMIIGILVLINIISIKLFVRIDLTKTHAYSLSKVSKQYMRQLKDPLTVKAFFTKKLPPPYNANARYLRDLLEDYRAYSNGNFNYQFLDPADDPKLAQEARSLGVYQIQLTAVEKDKFEQKNGYMGLAIVYQGRKEVIPLLQDTTGMEYQLSGMIKKLIQDEMKVVGITQGFGEPAYETELSNLVTILSKNYEVQPVNLKTGTIPERIDALVVAGPTEMIPDDKRYLLDHFLRSGKNLALLVRMVKADARQTMQAKIVDSQLSQLVAAYGGQIMPDLVYDAQCQKISVAQRGPGFIMQNIVPYPPFPLVTHVDAEHLIVKNLESFTLPFVSSLSLNQAVVEKNQLVGSVLARSSEHAWSQMKFFMLSPQYIQPPQKNEMKQYDLMLTLTGAFPSAFGEGQVPLSSDGSAVLPAYIKNAKPARLVVVGGADFITNDFIDLRRKDGLAQLTQNMIDWVAQDDALIAIRSKGGEAAAIGKIAEGHRQFIKIFNSAGLPVLVIIVGLVLWRRMEARRAIIAAQFNQSPADAQRTPPEEQASSDQQKEDA